MRIALLPSGQREWIGAACCSVDALTVVTWRGK